MIVIYSKNNCPACERAKALFKQNSLDFCMKNIDNNLDAMDFVVEQGHRAMPVVYLDDVFFPSAQAVINHIKDSK